MPQATNEPTTPTRRAALRGTANALLAGLLAPQLASAAPADTPDAASVGVGGVPTAARSTKLTTPPHPDAELLALAEFYFAGQPVIDAWNRGEIAEEEAKPTDDRLIEAVERMAEIPAATVGGIHAKARVALHSMAGAGQHWDFDARLAQAALQDLVREVLA
ncbi:MAG: hypothetical protein BGO51_13635 [Rhodospirillales bacterium 69-11]|nr:hypothetical protein [Rhodospirillales bacterium]OJW26374.1 MAG: hypothetical protein BGO51_13635 [Rhodospirillales bacterium 69-11]